MSDSDFDSLFVIGEADQSALVAKQQMTYQGSGYNSPSRGSPARRNQVSSQSPSDTLVMTDQYKLSIINRIVLTCKFRVWVQKILLWQ